MLLNIVAIFISTLIIWKASDWIGDAGDHLAYYYNMPSVVKGAIVVAIASSFPELATVVISTVRHGVFELGVGTVVGSAVFNILIIPALCQLIAKKPLKATKDIVYKEGFFYVIAICSILFVLFYGLVFNPCDGLGTITPALAAIPFLMYFVYVYIQIQETNDGEHEVEDFDNSMSKGKAWGMMLIGMIFVGLACELLVTSVLDIGAAFSLSPMFLGITICAAATSVPDTLLSIRDAKQGEHDAALANAFGSNTFDLLVCIPAGVFIAGVAYVDVIGAIAPMGYLILATFIALILMRNRLKLETTDSIILLILYLVFVIWQYLSAIGVA